MQDNEATSSRIKFAWYSATWKPETQTREELTTSGVQVAPTEYDHSMEGALFCPKCFTSLFRTPRESQVFANGRKACFAHFARNGHIPCDLRSTTPEGKRYANEEEARRAIAADELVIVHAFQTEAPSVAGLSSGTYDQSAVEQVDGPLTEVPISRYQGEPFRLPSRLATVKAICRNFALNLHRYYVLPGSNTAVLLTDALRSVKSINGPDDVPRLYCGRIKSSRNAGKWSHNTRMTWLEHAPSVHDLCIKDTDAAQAGKGIDDDSEGRVVLVWGRVTESGIGLCFTALGWGEYALLPRLHEHLLSC
jgi:hypothetical protein